MVGNDERSPAAAPAAGRQRGVGKVMLACGATLPIQAILLAPACVRLSASPVETPSPAGCDELDSGGVAACRFASSNSLDAGGRYRFYTVFDIDGRDDFVVTYDEDVSSGMGTGSSIGESVADAAAPRPV